MATPAVQLLNLEDYGSLPSDGRRYEIMEGILYMTPAPACSHQQVVFNLCLTVGGWARAHSAGTVLAAPIDVVLGDHDIVQPDLVFISSSRRREVVRERVYGPPDLIVEVLSPSTDATDRRIKRQLYARHRVKEYWLISVRSGRLERLTLGKGAYGSAQVFLPGQKLTSPVLPGLVLEVDEIFLDVEGV